MLVAHSSGILMLDRNSLDRERGAQPVSVAINSRLTQARPNMKHAPHVGGLAARTLVDSRCSATIHCQGRFVRKAGKWPSCANLHRTFRLFEFRATLLGMACMECRKRRVVETTIFISRQRPTPCRSAKPSRSAGHAAGT